MADRTDVASKAGDVVGDVAGAPDVMDGGESADAGADAAETSAMDAVTDAGMPCPSMQTTCDGRCVSLRDDARNCGACGMVCAEPDGGTVACVEGRCTQACGAGMAVVGGACVAIRAPRPVAPLSTATVTNHRPTLRWALAEGTDGARVEICRDRACTMLVTSLDVTGSSARPTADLTPGVWFWRLRGQSGSATGTAQSPTWQFYVGARSTPVDTSWGHTSDFNGDGYADLLVGVDDTVRYYRGSASGIREDGYATIRVPVDSGLFWSIANAGDVNGDGYADVAVGTIAPTHAFLYWGGPGGPATMPNATISRIDFGLNIIAEGLGDFDGDGYCDVLLYTSSLEESFIYFGSAAGPMMLARRSVGDGPGAVVGDINGDGLADVLVWEAGGARIVRGSPRSILSPMTNVIPAVRSSVFSGIGDINGDGWADASLESGSPAREQIYLGGMTGLLPGTWSAPAGVALVPVGDTNADGFADVAYRMTTPPQLVILHGNSSGEPSRYGVITYGVNEGYGDGASGTRGILSPGDVNGDVYADMIVGAPRVDSILIYHGRPIGLAPTPTTTLTGLRGTMFGGMIAAPQ